ncbi:YkgJ family cysteine cluster protein [Paenibacillus bovis]|uniref:Zinc/iron-chelating domain-containing protein n=1 Tax=Paenibacillus bovis TaxID=1616788 RepID=A0A172ZB96_9BACL|nr:zinc/iron-chelating domain-containing protein [Paenibacillus bovis]ANF94916.1 hypothetical protein AR543_01955 [Paenibacillus bovis]
MPDEPTRPLSGSSPCFCGSGRKLQHCHKTAAPDSRAAHVYQLYQDVDRAIEEYRTDHQAHPPCAAGCSSCCSDYFPVSQVEFELLLTYMERHWSKAEIQFVFEQSLINVEIFQQENPQMYASLTSRTSQEQELEQIRRYAGRNSFACPLLDPERGICRVYPLRPFICRTHGSSHTFYGSWRERLLPEKVCEHIPNSRAHRKVTPNIVDYWPQYEQLADVRVGAKQTRMRQYPIFYWFVLYARHGGGMTAQIGNRDHFDLPLDEHNARMARHEAR